MKRYLLLAFLLFLDVTGAASLVSCSRGTSGHQEPKAPNGASSLGKDTSYAAIDPGGKPILLLRNVRFRLSDKLYLDVRELLARTVPRAPHRAPDMNNVNSMVIELVRGCAYVDMPVIEQMFNQALDAPSSSIKDFRMSVVDRPSGSGTVKRLRVEGRIQMGVWIDFEMIASPSLDRGKTKMLIEVEQMSSLGISGLKGLLEISGLTLERLVNLPQGCGIEMKGNRILVDAFALLPPPLLTGPLSDVRIEEDRIAVYIGGDKIYRNPGVLDPMAKNFIYLEGGTLYFGNMGIFGGRIQINDDDDGNIFDFYLAKYLLTMEKSRIKMSRHNYLRILMPDYKSESPVTASSR